MSSIHQAFGDYQRRLRLRLMLESLPPAKGQPGAAESSPPEQQQCERHDRWSGATCASAQRVMAQRRRLHPTASYLASCRGQGAARRWRKPFPLGVGFDALAHPGQTKHSDNDSGSTSGCNDEGGGLTSTSAAESAVAATPRPPAYDTLFTTADPGRATAADMQEPALGGPGIVRVGIQALMLAQLRIPRDGGLTFFAVVHHLNALWQITNCSITQRLIRAQLARKLGVDPRALDSETEARELISWGRDLEVELALGAAQDWERVRKQPCYDRFVFQEQQLPTRGAAELRNLICYLRPDMLAKYPSRWEPFLQGAARDPMSVYSKVLELATQGLFLLAGNDIDDDDLLEPQCCAAMALLVRLLRLSQEELRSLQDYNRELVDAVLQLHSRVNDARLHGRAYEHISPGDLYRLLYIPTSTSLDSGPPATAAATGGAGAGAGHMSRFSPQHLVDILRAMHPQGNLLRRQMENNWIMRSAKPGFIKCLETNLSRGTLPDEVLNLVIDVQAAVQYFMARLGLPPASRTAAGGGGGGGGGTAAPSTSTSSVTVTVGAGVREEPGLYDTLYGVGLLMNQLVPSLTTHPVVAKMEATVFKILVPLARDARLCLSWLLEEGLLDGAAPEENPLAVERLRGLLRSGAAAAAASQPAGPAGSGVPPAPPPQLPVRPGLRHRAERQSARWVEALQTSMWMTKALMGSLRDHMDADVLQQTTGVALPLPPEPELGRRARSAGGGGGGGDDALSVAVKRARDVSELAEALRPGLLRAYPDTWGRLLSRAPKESSVVQESTTAMKLANLAVTSLALLAGEEVPLAHFQLSNCILAALLLQHRTRIRFQEVTSPDFRRLPAAQPDPTVWVQEASLAFRWLALVPRMMCEALRPETRWISRDLAVQVDAALKIDAALADGAAAAAAAAGAGAEAGTARRRGAAGPYGAAAGDCVWVPNLERSIRSLLDFVALRRNLKVIILAHMAAGGLAQGRQRIREAVGEGQGAQGGAPASAAIPQQQQQARRARREPWPLPWYAQVGHSLEQEEVAKSVVALCAVDDNDDDDDGDEEGEAAEGGQVGARELPQSALVLGRGVRRGPGGEDPWWRRPPCEPDVPEGLSAAVSDVGGRGSGGRDFVYVADDKPQVVTRRVTRGPAPATAAEASSLLSSSSSSSSRWLSRGAGSGGGTAAADTGGAAAGPRVLGRNSGVMSLLPLLQLLEPTSREGHNSAAARPADPAASGREEVLVEGGEAATLLVMLLIRALSNGMIDNPAFQLAEGDGGSGGATAAAGAAASARGTATAAAAAATAAGGSAKRVDKAGRKGQAQGREQQPQQEQDTGRMRLSLCRGHPVESASVTGEQITITAGSKLTQQVKLVRKAFLDERKSSFILKAVGVDGVWKALRLGLQVQEAMRATGRDLLMQLGWCYLQPPDSDSDAEDADGSVGVGGDGGQMAAGERRSLQRKRRRERQQRLESDLHFIVDNILDCCGGLMEADRMGLTGEEFYVGDLCRRETQGDTLLAALTGQLTGEGGIGSSSGSSGGGEKLRDLIGCNLMLLECEPGQPLNLVVAGRAGSGVVISRREARKQLEKKMMSE